MFPSRKYLPNHSVAVVDDGLNRTAVPIKRLTHVEGGENFGHGEEGDEMGDFES